MSDDSHIGRADLHMHTTLSDGLPTVEEVLNHVAEQGHLDVIAITDHDLLDASLWAYERRERYSFDIVPGMEVTTATGHVLALWVTQPIPRRMSFKETVAAIHEQGGIAVLAHPFHWHIGDVLHNFRSYWKHPETLVDCGFDAIEVHNAGVVTPMSNKLARRLAEQLGMVMLGNSDAHTLGAIGSGRTRYAGRTADDLRLAMSWHETVAEGTPWPLADYLQIGRALPHWKGNPTPAALDTSAVPTPQPHGASGSD